MGNKTSAHEIGWEYKERGRIKLFLVLVGAEPIFKKVKKFSE